MYISIEGVIGVGKTSLTRLLQPVFQAEIVLEIFEENPFLGDFYGDRKRYAFQTQIFFLLSRYRQQCETIPDLLAKGNLISDYTFEKDAIFAHLNLNGDELETYTLLHEALAERIHTPDLIVYLRADTNTAMQRIAMRDRSYERNMERNYIEALIQAYDHFFTEYKGTNVLTIDTTLLDFVASKDHFNFITNRIKATLAIPPYQPELPLQDEMSL
ncbi:MAG: deoxynucleoside kinase [Anaerolineales bacterium]|nr:MAG: deoxynucleoside kinase [Anaerolineales bacterium]